MRKHFIVASFAALAVIAFCGAAPSADQNFTRVSFHPDRASAGDRLMTVVHRARKGPVYAQAACGPAGGPTCAAGEYCCHFNQLNQYGCCKDVAHCCSDGCCQ